MHAQTLVNIYRINTDTRTQEGARLHAHPPTHAHTHNTNSSVNLKTIRSDRAIHNIHEPLWIELSYILTFFSSCKQMFMVCQNSRALLPFMTSPYKIDTMKKHI